MAKTSTSTIVSPSAPSSEAGSCRALVELIGQIGVTSRNGIYVRLDD